MMANGHGGDRRSVRSTPEEIAANYTNRRLLKEVHRMEYERLAESEQDTVNSVLDVPWPDRYAALVAEAQRRKLCL
jgi:hypothetical protein